MSHFCNKVSQLQPTRTARKLIVYLKNLKLNRNGLIQPPNKLTPSHFTVQKRHSLGYKILGHPTYSPAISAADYHLLKHFQLSIHKRRFCYSKEVVEVFEQFIKAKNNKSFFNEINGLELRWENL